MKNIKNIIKAFKNIEEELKECYINSFINPSFAGWKRNIYLNQEGELFISDPISTNSFLMGEQDGTIIKVYSLKACEEIGFEAINESHIEELTEKEQKELFEYVQDDWRIEELKETATEEGEEFDLYYCLANCQNVVEQNFEILFKEKHKEAVTEYLEAVWYDVRDNIEQEIIDYVENNL